MQRLWEQFARAYPHGADDHSTRKGVMQRGCMKYGLVVVLVACGGGRDSSATGSEGGDPLNGACTTLAAAESQTLVEIMVDGVRRQYRLSAPQADAGVALPVLMAFHGGDGRNYPFPQQQEFEELVEAEGVIVVYPLAELVPPNEGEWQLNTSESSTQDIDFVEALIDDLSARYCVDSNRIYATGYSLGSMFTYELACHLSSRFAAIASFAGTMPMEPNSCVLEDNASIMHIHGQDDWIISYDTAWEWKEWDSVGTMMDIPSLIRFWSEQYNCQNESETQSDSVLHIVHDACDEGVRVEHYRLTGVEHEWPGTISGVSTHEVIWNFVSEFTKPYGSS